MNPNNSYLGRLICGPTPSPPHTCGGEGQGEEVLSFVWNARKSGRVLVKLLTCLRIGVLTLALLTINTACRREMYYQPRGDPLKSSDFFANGAASRPLPPHTVPQENFHADLSYDTGKIETNFLTQIPFPVTRQVLERGREQFDIYCSVCHGRTGQGNGIVPQRGFPAPPSYDIQRLRDAQPGYFFNVMTRGYGVMFSYANRVNTDDRWAIAAYIRALQLSRTASLADVPPDERAKLEAKSP